MRLGVHIPAYGRHDLLRLVLAQLDRCRDGHDLAVAVVASEADRKAASAADYFRVAPNRPLPAKFNISCKMLRGEDVDACMILGSDDLVTPRLFDTYERLLAEGYDYIGLQDCHFFDVLQGELYRWCHPPGVTVGAGRCLSRRLLERLEWMPWQESDVVRGLDPLQEQRIKAEGGEVRRWAGLMAEAGELVDVKTADDAISDIPRCEVVDGGWGKLVEWFGAEMAARVRGL